MATECGHSALQRHENLCYKGCAPRIMPENVPAASVRSAIFAPHAPAMTMTKESADDGSD
jgi:hypothetical protein